MDAGSNLELSDPSAIIQVFQRLQGECQQMATKLHELEQECSEHELVIQQLTPLDPSRKAYRLVGGVLMERTVAEVLPILKETASKLRTIVPQLDEALVKKQKQTREWREKYNIRAQSPKEIQAAQQKAAAAAGAGADGGEGSGGGVLA
ncbi:prefoldin subunit 2 [Nannochloropsis oceanica]